VTLSVPSPAGFAELPLLLADVPQGIGRLLRDVGLPTRDWEEPVPAGGARGRFVLIDSRQRGTGRRLRGPGGEGLEILDLRELAPRCDDFEETLTRPTQGRHWSPAAQQFLGHLKQALEERGGVWARLADYPFPFQSVLAVGIEYTPESVGEYPQLARELSSHTTHFLPLGEPPARSAGPVGEEGTRGEVGWRITRHDCSSSNRRTVAGWQSARVRWSRAGAVPVGLLLEDSVTSLPSPQALLNLGLHLRVQSHEGGPWVGAGLAGCTLAPWVDVGAHLLVAPTDSLDWMTEQYQHGQPLFVLARAGSSGLANELRAFERDCQRCSLLWQTSLSGWAHWWGARRGAEFALWRTPLGYTVQTPHPLPPGDWGLELWRGSHFATLPLSAVCRSIAEDGLPFTLGSRRHPAGLAVARIGSMVDPVTSRPHWSGLGEWLHSWSLFRH
jgi:hypothetical protein